MREKERKVMEPQIVFEDEFLLVIDKPSGMIVNRADTTAKIETVQDWVEKKRTHPNPLLFEEKLCLQREGINLPLLKGEGGGEVSEFEKRAGIVHRLDKETSGLLLIAKTSEAFLNLQAQFKNREVKKKYLALVHGKVLPEEGEINAPVGRLPWNRERFGVMPGGKEAVTRYKVLNYYDESLRSPAQFLSESNRSLKEKKLDRGSSLRIPQKIVGLPAIHEYEQQTYSLLELTPLTGRTHQIRIHLQYLGFPIVGDTFYAGRKQALEDRKFCPRVFLHASSIFFKHPMSGKLMEFNAALPEELEKILKRIM